MKNAKRILSVLIVLAVVVSCVFVLAACKKHECTSKCETCGKCTNKDCTEEACKEKCPGHESTPQAPEAGDIPTEDGKVTLYWTIKHTEGIDTSYSAYYFVGGVTGWKTGADSLAYELKQLGTSTTYYVLVPFENFGTSLGTSGTDEYKLVIGYNQASGQDSSKLGVNWGNEAYNVTKGDGENGNVTGALANAESGKALFVGEWEFSGKLGAPVPVEDIDLRLNFAANNELFTDKTVVYIVGGFFDNWGTTVSTADKKAVSEATRNTSITAIVSYSVHVDSIIAAESIDWSAVVFPTGLGDKKPVDAEGKEIAEPSVWDYYGIVTNAIQIKLNGGNCVVGISEGDGGSYVDLTGSSFKGAEEGIDITKAEGKVLELGTPVEVTFTVTFSAALPAGVKVFLCGSGIGDIAWDGTNPMDASTDRKTFTLKMSAFIGQELEFKVVVGTENAAGPTGWPSGAEFGLDGGKNAKVKVEKAGALNLFEDALTYTAA